MWLVRFDTSGVAARGRCMDIPVSAAKAQTAAEAIAWARGYAAGRDMHIRDGLDLSSARVEREPTRGGGGTWTGR
jgi:hypothetical protein